MPFAGLARVVKEMALRTSSSLAPLFLAPARSHGSVVSGRIHPDERSRDTELRGEIERHAPPPEWKPVSSALVVGRVPRPNL